MILGENSETSINGQYIWRYAKVLKRGGRSLVNSVADIILPPKCASCQTMIESHNTLCAICWKQLLLIERPFCERTGIPFAFNIGSPSVSLAAQQTPPIYGKARAACLFKGTARTLMYSLKYSDRHDVISLVSHLMVRAGTEIMQDADIIIPVPLHWSRLWQRRFNQSTMIAQKIAKSRGKSILYDVLLRSRRTRPQVGLTISQRQRNVDGAFVIAKNGQKQIKGANVLLIDDIITTGATIDTCAKVLLRSGVLNVDVLTFARVADYIETPI